ncbi:hypothetical protein [Microvirga rosea]|uniref:hypothetical protein n=1 Tax=Microvirga rosea TaxID=2715425 RepID=UPI001D0B26C1|nr:hypothetical protein [Microvirga rosea]MCB8823135.1 hypothetical protein [Microvirga rosea]
MLIRTPTKTELVIQGLLVALLVGVLVDFFQALGAAACTDPNAGENCYPWGMTEDPMEGESWNYRNKANYLISSGAWMIVVAMAALAPFVARGRRSGLIALAAILVLGRLGFWLATA